MEIIADAVDSGQRTENRDQGSGIRGSFEGEKTASGTQVRQLQDGLQAEQRYRALHEQTSLALTYAMQLYFLTPDL